MEGGTNSTGLDVGIEANVVAYPSGTKFGGIPHGNQTCMADTDWITTIGTNVEAVSEITVL